MIAMGADGAFAGYASVFGRPDAGGDVVMPGAFAASLDRRGAARIRLLFQHDPKEPVGVWDSVREDAHGLHVEGRLTAGVPRAEALRGLIAAGAIDGLSIGFRTIRARRERGGLRRLLEVELWEISIVTFPMMEGARILPRPANDTHSLRAAISALRRA